MIITGLWILGAVVTVAGAFKLKKLVNIIKQGREVYQAYHSAKRVESDQGVEISAAEWRKIAKESMDVIELLAVWAMIWYQGRNK